MIFIELEYPRELIVVIQIANPGSYDPYRLYTVEFGRDVIDDITESKQFSVIDKEEISLLFEGGRTHDYDQIKDRVVCGFKYKNP